MSLLQNQTLDDLPPPLSSQKCDYFRNIRRFLWILFVYVKESFPLRITTNLHFYYEFVEYNLHF